ncbi:hypothetical protein RF11_15853 [Thelohanellus kitauei]|uniref:Tetraspanin n=1 Tax=Thelohanellus kitauei TaxID=669202 RepID=A0A0C2I956_THEKT|nr:hypothetical protein RF11_15853 [Thelohanellus kitauei]
MTLRIICFSALSLTFCVSIAEAGFSFFLNNFGIGFCDEFTDYNLVMLLKVLGFTYSALAMVGLVIMFFRTRSLNYIYGCVFTLVSILLIVVTIIYVDRLSEIDMILEKCSQNKLSFQELKDNKLINYIQRQNKCCGINGMDDWKDNEFPSSCCEGEPQDCHQPVTNTCAVHIKELVVNFGNLIVGGLCTLLFISVFISITKPIVIISIIKSLEE